MVNRSDADAAAPVPASRIGECAAAWTVSHWATVGTDRVRYREAGSGPPIVLVHGLGLSADLWVRNAPVLASEGFRVLAPDLPGFGRTAGPVAGLDVHAQADALRKWAEVVEVGPAVYVGHSLSCQTILQLAAERPGEVAALALAAPTGDGTSVRRLVSQAIGLARDVPRESIKLAMLVAEAYLRAGPLRVLRTWRLGARHDPLPLLAGIPVPSVVILGENDPVVDHEFARALAAGLPNGSLVLIPDGSHAVIFEPTGQFNRAILTLARRAFAAS